MAARSASAGSTHFYSHTHNKKNTTKTKKSYKPPVVLTMFGAKPPGSVLRNMTRQFLARQLAKTPGARPQKDMSALIVPNYVEVNL